MNEFSSHEDAQVTTDTQRLADTQPVEVTDAEDILVLDEVTDPELALPVWEATGNAEVDSALEMIQLLDPDNIHEHADALGKVHEKLHNLMANLDR